MKSENTLQESAQKEGRRPALRKPMLLDETGSWEVDLKERYRWLERIVYPSDVRACWTTKMGSRTKWGHTIWSVKVNGKRRSILAHRAVYFLVNGFIPSGMLVLHNCPSGPNPSCVNPSHMYLGTDAHNVRDCEAQGRGVHPKGEKHGRAKFSEEHIRNMLVDIYLHGHRQVDVVARYGCTKSDLSKVIQGLNWSHVGSEFGITKKDQAIYRTKVSLQLQPA